MPASAAGGNRLPELVLPGSPALLEAGARASASAPVAQLRQNFARTPLSFEANQGQTAAQVQYVARGPGYTMFLTATEAVLALSPPLPASNLSLGDPVPDAKGGIEDSPLATAGGRGLGSGGAVVRMEVLDGNPAAQASGVDQLPGIVNYFLGKDPSKWRTRIPTYGEVQYQDVYPGIGLVYYGNQQQLEYDFQVAPGADPGQIRLGFAGAQSVSVAAGGDLVVQAGGQVLRQHQPVVYQEVAGQHRQVAAGFVMQGQQVSFALGSYDRSRPLVIDPVLSYSTYLGGSGNDKGTGIAVDVAGNAYVTGFTSSRDFPTANPLQPALAGSVNAFVAELTADGSALVYSTYLGGSGDDRSVSIAVDAVGNAYVTGTTGSRDFPTVNAFQDRLRSAYTAFVAELSAGGSGLVYSTYLGGSGRGGDGEQADAIAVDAAGNAYVTGETYSHDFPTVNALQPAFGGGTVDAFIAKLTADGSALDYSTFLGGSSDDRGFGIAVDAAGNAYVTGFTRSRDFPTANPLQPALAGGLNAFATKLTADGSALVYSTYLGGSTGAWGFGIAVDAAGNAYVTGETFGPDFPTMNALQPVYGGGGRDAFVAKLTADGSALVYSTYLGGSGDDLGYWNGIAVDAAGNAYVSGLTSSLDFPTVNPVQSVYGGGPWDAFVVELTADGSALVYSTYLGGSGDEAGYAAGIAVDAAGNAYVTGSTTSRDFPTANALQPAYGGGDSDAFVAKISP